MSELKNLSNEELERRLRDLEDDDRALQRRKRAGKRKQLLKAAQRRFPALSAHRGKAVIAQHFQLPKAARTSARFRMACRTAIITKQRSQPPAADWTDPAPAAAPIRKRRQGRYDALKHAGPPPDGGQKKSPDAFTRQGSSLSEYLGGSKHPQNIPKNSEPQPANRKLIDSVKRLLVRGPLTELLLEIPRFKPILRLLAQELRWGDLEAADEMLSRIISYFELPPEPGRLWLPGGFIYPAHLYLRSDYLGFREIKISQQRAHSLHVEGLA